MLLSFAILIALCTKLLAAAVLAPFQPTGPTVSLQLYRSLEELARIVDIAYCVGSTGIQKPFKCLSRCSQFEGFELVQTWNTGPLLSDSCGYIALSHEPDNQRVIVAFRGTYSIANTIADLSTYPAKYAPYPGDGDEGGDGSCSATIMSEQRAGLPKYLQQQPQRRSEVDKCTNCTVHSGFLSSWRNTRCTIIPVVEKALNKYPNYRLVLVGHSLGGAVAALAALEFQSRGWTPQVTTFGEPRIGNQEFANYIDERFDLSTVDPDDSMYRRVTHVDDPVPLLPLEEWGYKMHAGEIFISKSGVPPSLNDLHHCIGDEDPMCIQEGRPLAGTLQESEELNEGMVNADGWSIPTRYKLWQLFFAHRDYFWRLGLCLPGGYPWDWNRHDHDYDYDDQNTRLYA